MLRFVLSASPFSTFFSTRFPVFLFRFLVLGLLFVSFHPSLIRSHSCFSGASLVLSLSGFSPSLPLSFVSFRSGSGYLAFCFFLSVSSCFCLTVASSVLRFCFRFFGLPHSFLPDFSCILSRFSYSAFLQFLSPPLFRLTGATSSADLFLSALGQSP